MRCFYCKNLNNSYADLDEIERKHLFSILRMKEGSNILLIDGNGGVAEGLIGKDQNISLISFKQFNKPKTKVHLYIAPPRKQKMDLLLTQCTEAGVWGIHSMFTENSVALPQKETTVDRWQLKLIEACKQSHNPFLPKIHSPISFNTAVENVDAANLSAFFGSTNFDNSSINKNSHEQSEAAWFVGPEGGFTEEETRVMIQAGFQGLSIGNWIMRVETAAVIGTVLLQQE